MAEQGAQLRHARSRGPRSNWVPLGVAAAVVAVLTAGWALVNAGLPQTEDLAAGQNITLGSGDGYEASMSVDDGWELDTGSSAQGERYVLTKGPVNLQVRVVTPVARASATELWEGMREIVRVGDASAALGEPKPVTSEGGAEGLTGDLHVQQRTGTATVFPSPGGDFAVQTQAIGADATPAELADAEQLVQSIRFNQATGGNS